MLIYMFHFHIFVSSKCVCGRSWQCYHTPYQFWGFPTPPSKLNHFVYVKMPNLCQTPSRRPPSTHHSAPKRPNRTYHNRGSPVASTRPNNSKCAEELIRLETSFPPGMTSPPRHRRVWGVVARSPPVRARPPVKAILTRTAQTSTRRATELQVTLNAPSHPTSLPRSKVRSATLENPRKNRKPNRRQRWVFGSHRKRNRPNRNRTHWFVFYYNHNVVISHLIKFGTSSCFLDWNMCFAASVLYCSVYFRSRCSDILVLKLRSLV